MDTLVYQEWQAEDVPSGHGDGITYHVFVGTVNWEKIPGHERTAFVVLMKYGGVLAYHIPPHILEEDTDAVLGAIARLRAWRESERT
jgi:hypothetical protein